MNHVEEARSIGRNSILENWSTKKIMAEEQSTYKKYPDKNIEISKAFAEGIKEAVESQRDNQ